MISSKKGWDKESCYFYATPLGQQTALALCPLYRGEDFAWNTRAGEKA
ncbi:hypothetical protein AmDm5_1850 [Acetobacter malorum]|nr:hypothetical protein AmDm5_1850 [Acetobacter malorum]